MQAMLGGYIAFAVGRHLRSMEGKLAGSQLSWSPVERMAPLQTQAFQARALRGNDIPSICPIKRSKPEQVELPILEAASPSWCHRPMAALP